MSRNGSGVYDLPAGNPVVTGTTISTTWANNTLNDIATALTGSVAADGQTTITGNQDFGGFHHTNVADAVADDQYATLGQVKSTAIAFGTAGGTANAITISTATGIGAYSDGLLITAFATNSNTGAAAANVDAVGSKNIKKYGNLDLAPFDILATQPMLLIYRASDGILELINPATFAHGADIASAGAINLDNATGDYVTITGTTAITAPVLRDGQRKVCRFSGALTLTNGANFQLPNSANITTVANDIAVFRGLPSGVVILEGYIAYTGAPDYAVAAGTANTITASYRSAYLGDGAKLRVKATAANTSAVTFSPNSLTAHAIVTAGLSALVGGELANGTELELTYDLTNTRWIWTNSTSATRSITTFTGSFNTGGGTTSVSLTGGPYKTIRGSWAGLSAATDYQIFMRINADTGNNYGWAANDVNDSGAGASHGASGVSGICLQVNTVLLDDNATDNGFSGAFQILNAQSITDIKSGFFQTGMARVATGGLNGIVGGTFQWANASAVSAVSFILGNATGTSPSGSAVNAATGTYTIECIP